MTRVSAAPKTEPKRRVSVGDAARILASRDPVIARLIADAGPPSSPRRLADGRLRRSPRIRPSVECADAWRASAAAAWRALPPLSIDRGLVLLARRGALRRGGRQRADPVASDHQQARRGAERARGPGGMARRARPQPTD